MSLLARDLRALSYHLLSESELREILGSMVFARQVVRGLVLAALVCLSGCAPATRSMASRPLTERGGIGGSGAGVSVPRVGAVYKIEGVLNGKPVVYVGSAVDLKTRLTSDHHWADLIKSDGTTIMDTDVHAELNVAASGRGTLRSAQSEALRAAEERVLQETERNVARRNADLPPGKPRIEVLNKRRPAVNAAELEARHQVSTSGKWRVLKSPGASVQLAGFVLLQVYDLYKMYYDTKMSQYEITPHILEDEMGAFTFGSAAAWWGARTFWKTYITGSLKGSEVELTEEEFSDLKSEAEALYGTTDWKGDFVPGLLRPAIPEQLTGPEFRKLL